MNEQPNPAPPTVASVLDRFLVESPPHPVEIHVTDELQRKSVSETIGDGILTEVVHGVLDTEPLPEGQRRQIRVQWVQPAGVVASVVFDGAREHHEILRRALLSSRRHRCIVRWFYTGGLVAGTSESDVFNAPRHVRHPGKLAPHSMIIDTPERFDVTFGKINRPGVVGKRILRRAPFEETWRVVLDDSGLAVLRVRRKETDEILVPRADLIAVVKNPWQSAVGSQQSILTTSAVVPFPRLSFLGRSFNINANDAWDFEEFVVQRVNQRLGV